MKFFTLVAFVSLLGFLQTANALTIEEIIKLRQGGVSDETIQLLIRRDSEHRLSGTWKTKDGWIIYSTQFGYKHEDAEYQNYYPTEVYPQVLPRRRWR